MPSRIRKKGNKWYYRIEIPDGKGGKKYTERVAGTTKKSAELAYWHAIEKNIAEGPFISPSAMTVSKYLEMWISDYVEINLRETTIKSYKSAIKYHINPAIGNVKIDKLTSLQIQHMINSKTEKYSKATINHILIVLKAALNYAVSPCNFIKINPAKNIRKANKAKPPQQTMIFTPEQINKILEKFPEGHHYHLAIMMAYHTGLRVGEVLGLHWNDISLDESELSVKGTMTESGIYQPFTKSMSSMRTIIYSKKLQEMLKKEHEKQLSIKNKIKSYNKNDYVCVREGGRRISTLDMRYFNAWCKETFGKGYSFHSFRHTHASMLLEAGDGHNLEMVSKRLGHSNINITAKVYSHILSRRKGSMLNMLNDIF